MGDDKECRERGGLRVHGRERGGGRPWGSDYQTEQTLHQQYFSMEMRALLAGMA